MISKFTLICIFGLLIVQNAYGFEMDFLPGVNTLTFVKGLYTIGNKPVPQLQCIDLNDSVCSKYQIQQTTCRNIGRVKGNMIGWECTAVFPKDIRFDKLNVQCERYPDLNDNDYIIRGSCALRYSLRDTSVGIGLIIFAVIAGVFVLVAIIACCIRCNRTHYHDHAPVSVVTGPACGTSVYTVPIAPAVVPVPTYYPSHHHDVHVGFSGTSYRNDGFSNTHVDTGYSGTTYRDGGTFDSGFTGVDTGYSGTDFR